MINFFRKIRKKLLTQNKVSKYLLYALGEILLVVVGILIALQVNNWNEDRSSRQFEIRMLTEIRKALSDDLGICQLLKERNEAKLQGIQEMLQMVASKESYPDTVILKLYNKMTISFYLIYNKGPYETIKSVGLDKISNDSVRSGLTTIYELELPRVDQFTNGFINMLREDHDISTIHDAIWKRTLLRLPDSTYKIVSTPLDNRILDKKELLDRIKIEQDMASNFISRLKYFESTLNYGLQLVSDELEVLAPKGLDLPYGPQ
jgi:hypothetical protein